MPIIVLFIMTKETLLELEIKTLNRFLMLFRNKVKRKYNMQAFFPILFTSNIHPRVFN